MSKFQRGQYEVQWSQLAPLDQAQWPSEDSRAAMLVAKFSGPSVVTGFRLGRPSAETTWTSLEDPKRTTRATYSVPVSVQFAGGSGVSPGGVCADYQHLALTVGETEVDRRLLPGPASPDTPALAILGEGPASIDAPVIEEAAPAQRTDNVPVLMYHLVGPLPIRSHYLNSYSYRLDYGLTVTPAQFSAEMAYLQGQGRTAISLVELTDGLLYGLPLPARPVVTTFDDGFLDQYQYAFPILRQVGFTATLFPAPG